jgi:hypothetical protein
MTSHAVQVNEGIQRISYCGLCCDTFANVDVATTEGHHSARSGIVLASTTFRVAGSAQT